MVLQYTISHDDNDDKELCVDGVSWEGWCSLLYYEFRGRNFHTKHFRGVDKLLNEKAARLGRVPRTIIFVFKLS